MMYHPSRAGQVDTGDIEVSRNGESVSFAAAAERGWLVAGLYEYDPSRGGYERSPAGAQMTPWKGYAVKALEECVLIISPTQP